MPDTSMPSDLKRAFLSSLEGAAGADFDLTPYKAAGGLLGDLDTYWALYADKGRLSLRLRYLHTQREGLDWIRRRVSPRTTFTEDGVTQADSDVFKAFTALRADIDSDIVTLEKQIRSGQIAASGRMTTTQIAPPPLYGFSPASGRYLGYPGACGPVAELPSNAAQLQIAALKAEIGEFTMAMHLPRGPYVPGLAITATTTLPKATQNTVYQVDTTAGPVAITLPASTGDLTDYEFVRIAGTNPVTFLLNAADTCPLPMSNTTLNSNGEQQSFRELPNHIMEAH